MKWELLKEFIQKEIDRLMTYTSIPIDESEVYLARMRSMFDIKNKMEELEKLGGVNGQ